jgi:hypothetical protein
MVKMQKKLFTGFRQNKKPSIPTFTIMIKSRGSRNSRLYTMALSLIAKFAVHGFMLSSHKQPQNVL